MKRATQKEPKSDNQKAPKSANQKSLKSVKQKAQKKVLIRNQTFPNIHVHIWHVHWFEAV